MKKTKKKNSRLIILGLVVSVALTGCSPKKDIKPEEDIKTVSQVSKLDERLGLVHKDSLKLDYAQHFKVDYYEGGYKLIRDSSDREILLVPEGKDIPRLPEEITILEGPIEGVGIYSTVDGAWFRALGEVDKIKTVTFEEEKWMIDEVAEGMKNGNITYVGKSSALDYESLQAIDPTVHLLSKSSADELFPKFDELDMKYISMGAFLEEDPRARLEWVKFAGALTDKDLEAEEFYQAELAKINKVVEDVASKNLDKKKVAIVYYSHSKEAFQVTHGLGHQAVTSQLAGGIHYPENFNMDKRGSSPMTNEEFFKLMEDVDIILYDNITGHGIQNMDDLLNTAPFVEDLNVVKEGNIWGLQKDYWQAADRVGDIIIDLHQVLKNEDGKLSENDYFFLMK